MSTENESNRQCGLSGCCSCSCDKNGSAACGVTMRRPIRGSSSPATSVFDRTTSRTDRVSGRRSSSRRGRTQCRPFAECDDELMTGNVGDRCNSNNKLSGRRRRSSSHESSGSRSRDFVRVAPKSGMLTFHYQDAYSTPIALIQVANRSLSRQVAFKVRSSSPDRYQVSPHRGLVDPLDVANVFIKLNNNDIERISVDRFSVIATKTERCVEDAACRLNDADFWQEAEDNGPSQFVEKKFRCCLVEYGVTSRSLNEESGGDEAATRVPNTSRSDGSLDQTRTHSHHCRPAASNHNASSSSNVPKCTRLPSSTACPPSDPNGACELLRRGQALTQQLRGVATIQQVVIAVIVLMVVFVVIMVTRGQGAQQSSNDVEVDDVCFDTYP